MWDAQLPDGEMIRGLACGYRCSSWRWSTTATTSAFGLSRVNADPRRLWSTRANVCEGNGLKPTSSVRVNSSSWVSLKPERLRAYKFSSRSFRSARSTWIRGTVGFLWTTDWIRANAIELAMESRSACRKEIRVFNWNIKAYNHTAHLVTHHHCPPSAFILLDVLEIAILDIGEICAERGPSRWRGR